MKYVPFQQGKGGKFAYLDYESHLLFWKVAAMVAQKQPGWITPEVEAKWWEVMFRHGVQDKRVYEADVMTHLPKIMTALGLSDARPQKVVMVRPEDDCPADDGEQCLMRIRARNEFCDRNGLDPDVTFGQEFRDRCKKGSDDWAAYRDKLNAGKADTAAQPSTTTSSANSGAGAVSSARDEEIIAGLNDIIAAINDGTAVYSNDSKLLCEWTKALSSAIKERDAEQKAAIEALSAKFDEQIAALSALAEFVVKTLVVVQDDLKCLRIQQQIGHEPISPIVKAAQSTVAKHH